MRQYSSFDIALLCLLCIFFFFASKAQIAVHDTSTDHSAAESVGNTISPGLRVNTTSNGLLILTDEALNATGRDPECDWNSIPGLTVASCEDAIAQIPDKTTSLRDPFGQPLQIPMRYSSCK